MCAGPCDPEPFAQLDLATADMIVNDQEHH